MFDLNLCCCLAFGSNVRIIQCGLILHHVVSFAKTKENGTSFSKHPNTHPRTMCSGEKKRQASFLFNSKCIICVVAPAAIRSSHSQKNKRWVREKNPKIQSSMLNKKKKKKNHQHQIHKVSVHKITVKKKWNEKWTEKLNSFFSSSAVFNDEVVYFSCMKFEAIESSLFIVSSWFNTSLPFFCALFLYGHMVSVCVCVGAQNALDLNRYTVLLLLRTCIAIFYSTSTPCVGLDGCIFFLWAGKFSGNTNWNFFNNTHTQKKIGAK